MSTYVGILREESDLFIGLSKLQELKQKTKLVCASSNKIYNIPGWHLCIDLRRITYMLTRCHNTQCTDTQRKAEALTADLTTQKLIPNSVKSILPFITKATK